MSGDENVFYPYHNSKTKPLLSCFFRLNTLPVKAAAKDPVVDFLYVVYVVISLALLIRL